MNKRQTQILDVLINQSTWITSNELAKEVGCSNKTVQHDVKKIREILPDKWDIKTERGKGILLQGPVNEDLNVELPFYSKDDLNTYKSAKLKIIEMLTSEKHLTIESLAESLHYNPHTIRQFLNEIELDLNKVQLQLKRSPLRIEGSELAIRFFIYQQRKYFYGEEFLFNKNYDLYKKYAKFLKLINKEERLMVCSLPMVKLLLFVQVNLERFKNGYVLNDGFYYQPILNLTMYGYLLPYILEIEKISGIKLPDDERVNIFFAFIYTEFYFSYHDDEKEIILEQFTTSPSSFPIAYEFILFLQTELQYHLLSDDAFVFSIYDLYKKIELRNMHVQYKYAGSRRSSLEVKEKYPDTYQFIKKVCTKWTSEKQLPQFTTDTVTSIVILLELFKLKNNPDKKKVAVIYSETIDLNNLTTMILKQEFANYITIQSIALGQIDRLDTGCYDLILTDSQLSKRVKNAILINKIPNDRDLAVIRRELGI